MGSGYWAGGQFSRSQPLTCCVTLGKLPSLAGPQLLVCKVEAIPPICWTVMRERNVTEDMEVPGIGKGDSHWAAQGRDCQLPGGLAAQGVSLWQRKEGGGATNSVTRNTVLKEGPKLSRW